MPVRSMLMLLALLLLPASVAGQETAPALQGEEPTELPPPADEAAQPDREPEPPRAERPVDAALARVEASLEALDQVVAGLPEGVDPAVLEAVQRARGELRSLLVELGSLRSERSLRSLLSERLAEPEARPTPEPTPSRPVLDPDALQALRVRIESAPFKDDKLAELREGLGDAALTTGQVAALLELFPLPSHRVDALILLYPRLADPENFTGLLATLKFESDRRAVLSGLGLEG